MNNAIYYAIITYIFFIVYIFMCKPEFIYDNKNKQFKEFGFGKSQTILSLQIVTIVSAMFPNNKINNAPVNNNMLSGGFIYVPNNNLNGLIIPQNVINQ